jgi:hypothetical protein
VVEHLPSKCEALRSNPSVDKVEQHAVACREHRACPSVTDGFLFGFQILTGGKFTVLIILVISGVSLRIICTMIPFP